MQYTHARLTHVQSKMVRVPACMQTRGGMEESAFSSEQADSAPKGGSICSITQWGHLGVCKAPTGESGQGWICQRHTPASGQVGLWRWVCSCALQCVLGVSGMAVPFALLCEPMCCTAREVLKEYPTWVCFSLLNLWSGVYEEGSHICTAATFFNKNMFLLIGVKGAMAWSETECIHWHLLAWSSLRLSPRL